MGAIVSDFGSLPSPGDPGWLENYQACFLQLHDMKLSAPTTAPENTSRADLLACLQGHAGDMLKTEINTDPAGAGYAGKSTAEITDLVQTFRVGDGPPRLSTIWTGLPFTPNAIVEADTIGALT